MSSNYRIQLESWLKTLDIKADNLLDVGGSQSPVIKRVKSWDVKFYHIFDLPTESRHFQGEDQFHTISGNIEIGIDPIMHGIYDKVFCLEVMEYVIDPVQTIKNIRDLMVKDGVLYISFPFIYPHHNPFAKDFLRYTRWGVQRLLDFAGFEIVDLIARKAIVDEPLQEFFSKEGMRRCKEYSDHDDIGYLVKAIKK